MESAPCPDYALVIDELEATLLARATPERAEFERGYLKSDLRFLGAKVPNIRQATRRLVRQLSPLDPSDTSALVTQLWERRVHELRMAATEVLRANLEVLTPEHLPWIEELIRTSKTWALVDNLAIHVVGPLTRDPRVADRTLDRWAGDRDFWIRRSALLAPLLELRTGSGDRERFSRYAETMLEEREFFIRRAIGWVLRETSKKDPDWVAEWLGERIDRVSGLTLREGSKRLSEGQRRSLRDDYQRA